MSDGVSGAWVPNHPELDLSAVPLFPLPTVVLFPRAVLPLHIFEQRYRQMTADALAGDRLIAMALLKDCWQKCYFQTPAIESVVCVGRIVSEERLPDGKYNLLLQGLLRATVVNENGKRAYRRAKLEPLNETPVMEIDLGNERHRLTCMLNEGCFATVPIVQKFRQMIAGPTSTATLADLLAFHFLDDIPLKQSLLADADVQRRVQRVLTALECARPTLEAVARRQRKDVGSVN